MQLFSEAFDADQLLFISTDTERTEETGKRVFEGMFPFFNHGGNEFMQHVAEHPLKDTIYSKMITDSIEKQTARQCPTSSVLRINTELQEMHASEATCPRLLRQISDKHHGNQPIQMSLFNDLPFHFPIVLKAFKETAKDYGRERRQKLTAGRIYELCDELISLYYALDYRTQFEDKVLESCQLVHAYLYVRNY